MAVISMHGDWYVVSVNGELAAYFVEHIDAHRFALGMLHDGIIDSATLLCGLIVG